MFSNHPHKNIPTRAKHKALPERAALRLEREHKRKTFRIILASASAGLMLITSAGLSSLTAAPDKVTNSPAAPVARLETPKAPAKVIVPPIKRAGAVGPVTQGLIRPQATISGLTWKQAAIYRKAVSMIGWRQDCVVAVARSIYYATGRWIQVWPWQYYSYGYPISYAAARPGDLVYYRNGGGGLAHIAIYAGNGRAVHGGWNGWTTVLTTVWIGSGPNFIRLR